MATWANMGRSIARRHRQRSERHRILDARTVSQSEISDFRYCVDGATPLLGSWIWRPPALHRAVDARPCTLQPVCLVNCELVFMRAGRCACRLAVARTHDTALRQGGGARVLASFIIYYLIRGFSETRVTDTRDA